MLAFIVGSVFDLSNLSHAGVCCAFRVLFFALVVGVGVIAESAIAGVCVGGIVTLFVAIILLRCGD